MQADVERFLARLLTDPGFRDRFLADRAGVAEESGLSSEEAHAVAMMPGQDLRTAARSYQHKRNAKLPRRRRNWLIDWFRAKLR
jgi:hypothetical protein